MNKNKAIQLLERLQDPEPYEPMLTKDAYDAIQMAIDALSADGDTISRKAAIDALDEIESEIADGYGYQYAKWREYFAEIPSAQPEQRYTEEELRVFQHGISLSLLSKRSAQHWRYDEETATEIKFLERLYEKVGADIRGEEV